MGLESSCYLGREVGACRLTPRQCEAWVAASAIARPGLP